MKEAPKPRQILLSKRANVFYLEHVRVIQKDGRVLYLSESPGDPGIDRLFNIPERNTVFVLLGKGSSITDAAVRKLAESNVAVGFVGSGGSPLFAGVDYVFLTGQSEYRPTEYMQAWMRIWLDEATRLATAKQFFAARLDWALEAWNKHPDIGPLDGEVVGRADSFRERSKIAIDTQGLMAVEGEWVKYLYTVIGRAILKTQFRRDENAVGGSIIDLANGFLNHGNYIAYGYAAAALHVLGISFALPVMHGKPPVWRRTFTNAGEELPVVSKPPVWRRTQTQTT